MRDRFVSLSCLACLAVIASSPAAAGVIGLSWDASAGAAGYRVYFGSSPGNYQPSPLYDGAATSAVIDTPALAGCQTWHFAVTAYNAAGESGYSTPVSSWPRPELTSATPGTAIQGSSIALTVQGESFDAGAVLETDNPNILLANPSSTCDGSCNCQYQVVATIEPTAADVQPAQIGGVTLSIRNPDGLSAASQAFEVLVNPARFDLNTTVPSTNGRLDGMDAAWLSKLFGTQSGDPSYDPDYDFDGDGWVDGVDLAYIGSNFGECWDGAAWNASACE